MKLGADPALLAGQWTACGLARDMGHGDIADLIGAVESSPIADLALGPRLDADKVKKMVRIYQSCFDEDTVNVDLIVDLIHFIDTKATGGAILVFLPGYEEILKIRDRLLNNDQRFSGNCQVTN